MKITFQGEGFHDILAQMKAMLKVNYEIKSVADELNPSVVEAAPTSAQGPGPDKAPAKAKPVSVTPAAPVDKTVDKPVDKPVDTAMADKMAKLRAARDAKKAAKAAEPEAKPQAVAKPKPPAKPPVEEPVAEEPQIFADPAEMVKIRQKTIADLQDAYANGHQAEVFELLSRFGNGAKSFRELPPDAFVPISEAIAKGALT